MHDQHLHAERTQFPWRNTGDTADGEEIRLSPVEVCSLSHYLRRVLAPCQVVSRSSEPSTLLERIPPIWADFEGIHPLFSNFPATAFLLFMKGK